MLTLWIVSPRVRTASTSSPATAVDLDVPSRPSRLVSLRRSVSEEGRSVKIVFLRAPRCFMSCTGAPCLGRLVSRKCYELHDMFIGKYIGRPQRIMVRNEITTCTL
jgi:hypothetical protein